MKKLLYYLPLLGLLLTAPSIVAQDLHYSQYLSAPVNLNPALAGFTHGNFRVNANYRNQWFALNSFATYAASVDANIVRTKMDYHMLGVGLSFYQDIEETQGLSNTNVALSTAFNLKVSERPLQYIGVGLQAGLIRKQVNLSDAIYGTLFENGNNFDPLGNTEYNSFNLDLGLGLSYYVYLDNRHAILTGFSLLHINQPNQGIIAEDFLYRRYSAYFMAHAEVNYNSTIWLRPTILFNKQGPSISLVPGVAVRYRFYNAINDVFLTFGLGMRVVGHEENNIHVADFIFKTQFEIEQFYLGFSYDVSVSAIKNATTRNGGPEISLSADLNFERRQPRYFKIIYE